MLVCSKFAVPIVWNVILSHFQVARLERAVKERMPEVDARLVILIFISF